MFHLHLQFQSSYNHQEIQELELVLVEELVLPVQE
jgi:hypothetical protein